MLLTEKIRAKAYWFTDWVTGGNVKKHYKNIRDIIENPYSSISTSACERNLLNLLKYAIEKVPYYRNYSTYLSLSDFPVINKNIIRDNQKSFIADSHKLNQLHKVTTSGSTGAPLTVWHDKIKRARHIAENIYFSELANYYLGTRLYYLRVWNEINRKNLLASKMQNIVMQDASDLSDDNIELFISRIESDKSTKSILAFASTLEAISQFLNKTQRKIKSNISSIISISETLPEGAKETLKEFFNCPVISRYSNMENGFIAQQCEDASGEYHINISGFYIEMLKLDKDEPVKNGEIGRVVVTDLFNFGMPMIRYDTGDIAIQSENSSCGKPGPVFKTVEGRRVDFIYNTSGKMLSPHVVTNTMWKYSNEIKQFQFIQNGANDYLLKLSKIDKEFNRENEIISDLKQFLGQDAVLIIEYVNEIPQLASGKRKKIINNWKTNSY